MTWLRALRRAPRRWRRNARGRHDCGSASTELVLLTPLLVALLGGFFLAGRLELARQDVDDAARTALQAAVTMPDAQQASLLARATASLVLAPDVGLCSRLSTTTDTSDFVAGGTVSVQVSCVVRFSSLAFADAPSSVTLTATRGAILEPYREIGP
jgi:Flp pilus assembly protein TadG